MKMNIKQFLFYSWKIKVEDQTPLMLLNRDSILLFVFHNDFKSFCEDGRQCYV